MFVLIGTVKKNKQTKKKKHISWEALLPKASIKKKTAQTNSAAIQLDCVLVPTHYGIFTIKRSML